MLDAGQRLSNQRCLASFLRAPPARARFLIGPTRRFQTEQTDRHAHGSGAAWWAACHSVQMERTTSHAARRSPNSPIISPFEARSAVPENVRDRRLTKPLVLRVMAVSSGSGLFNSAAIESASCSA